MVWGTFFRDEVPQSARLSAGGGGQLLKGQCPNAWGDFLNGASLRIRLKRLKLISLSFVHLTHIITLYLNTRLNITIILKMAFYCPQGSGTLRQQLLMMHGTAWHCMVLHGIAWYQMALHGIAWY